MEIELPNGTVLDIETDDVSVAQSAAQKYMRANGLLKAERTGKAKELYDAANPPETDAGRGAGTGIVQGMTDPLLGLGQIGIGLREAVGIPSSVSGAQAKKQLQQREQEIAASRGPDAGTDWARMGGNALSMLPLSLLPGGPIATGAVGGTIGGALQPATGESSLLKQKLVQTGIGAGSGLAGGAVMSGLSRAIGGVPNVRQAVTTLADEGVHVTPGQTGGGAASVMEERLASIPWAGQSIRNAQARSTEQLNEAAYRRALEPIGETVTSRTGANAVDEIATKLGAAYDAIIPQLSYQTTPQVAQQLAAVNVPGLSPAALADAQRIVTQTIGQAPALQGEALNTARKGLGYWATQYGASHDPMHQATGRYLQQVQQVFDGEIANQNPNAAPTLQAINEGYANYVRIRNAAARAPENGVFSANQLGMAVKQSDQSVGKGNVARGRALMQDLSQPAIEVMGPRTGSSGTTERALSASLPANAVGILTSPLVGRMYSPQGMALINTLLSGGTRTRAPFAALTGESSPVVNALMAPQISDTVRGTR